jgi:hypothetical protein
MRQPTFFDKESGAKGVGAEGVLLYALGEFQERGLVLAGRDLPFDRLRGAFRRAAGTFGVEEIGDEEAAAKLASLGAQVRRVPTFFAKHPFRVVVPAALAERAHAFFLEMKKTD